MHTYVELMRLGGVAGADEHALVAENLSSHAFKNEDRVPDLMDIPLSVVNRCTLGDETGAAARAERLKRPWPSQADLVAMPARVAAP
jgi:hypothetical protein